MIRLFSGNSRILIITVIIVLGLFLSVYILKPVIIGYNTYQHIKNSDLSLEEYGKSVKQLETNLAILNANLSICAGYNEKASGELDKNINKYLECKTILGILQSNHSLIVENYKGELEKLNFELQKRDKEIGDLKNENDAAVKGLIEKKDSEINEFKNRYDALARNTANNLCCKAKIDNPRIGYYKIENDRIFCLEEGPLEISC